MNKLILIPLAFFLGACSVGRVFEAPSTQQLTNESFKEGTVGRFSNDSPVNQWWQKLEDKQLSQLITEALKANHDIRIAYANLQEARSLLTATKFDYAPTITANSNANRQQLSNQDIFGKPSERILSRYDSSFDATWELDLFGRVRNSVASSRATLNIKEADLQGSYISIAAEVARNYIELRGSQYRLEVANKNLANQSKTYELIQALQTDGEGDLLNIERARTQLELTRSEIPLRQAEVNAAINKLSVLIGSPPGALAKKLVTAKSLPTIPVSINVGSPMNLLKRRPDIRAAEQALVQSTAEYNIRVSDLYPRVNLIGNVGFLSTSFADLGTGSSSTFLFGPNISWAAFNLGRVKQQIDAADARTTQTLLRFEQTVLNALEETDTAMINFSRNEESRDSLLKAASSSAKAAYYARERFNAGIDNFLDVLDAERTMLDAQDKLARSETELALNLIAIYKALGGGWQSQPIIEKL